MNKPKNLKLNQKRALVISHMANCKNCKKQAIKCMKHDDIADWEVSITKAPILRENEIMETKRDMLDRIEDLEETCSKYHEKCLWLHQEYKEIKNAKRKK